MRSVIKKSIHLFIALMIPASVLFSCQEDIQEPVQDGVPEPGKIVPPPKKNG